MRLDAVAKVYMSSGVIYFNDKGLDKSIEASFVKRGHCQVAFLLSLVLLGVLFPKLGIDFSTPGRILVICYLLLDGFLLFRRVTIGNQSLDLRDYDKLKFQEKFSTVGLLNSFIFVFILFELFF